MNTLARLGAAAAGTLLLAIGVAPAADAATYAHNDATGDVSVSTCDETFDCTDSTDATMTNGDIRRIVVSHGPRKVVIRTYFRDLERSDEFVVGSDIRTNEHIKRAAVLEWTGSSARVHLENGTGRRVNCTVGYSVDFSAHSVELRVPRRCLSRPRWVQTDGGYFRFHEDSVAKSFTVAMDDANSSTMKMDGDLTWGPRVRRG